MKKATRKAPRKAPRKTTRVKRISVIDKLDLLSAILGDISRTLDTIAKNTTPPAPLVGAIPWTKGSAPFDLEAVMRSGGNCKYRTSDQRVFPARIICTNYWAHKSDTEKQILVLYKCADKGDVLAALHKDGTEPGTRNQKLYN